MASALPYASSSASTARTVMLVNLHSMKRVQQEDCDPCIALQIDNGVPL